jgi:hypothetical protein
VLSNVNEFFGRILAFPEEAVSIEQSALSQ